MLPQVAHVHVRSHANCLAAANRPHHTAHQPLLPVQQLHRPARVVGQVPPLPVLLPPLQQRLVTQALVIARSNPAPNVRLKIVQRLAIRCVAPHNLTPSC